MMSRSKPQTQVDCRLDGGCRGGGYRCEALGAGIESIVISD